MITRKSRSKLPYATLEHARGYPLWRDTYGGVTKTVAVHQLLAIAEGEDPSQVFSGGEHHVHHKNGIQWDNRPDNIELLTATDHQKLHWEMGDIKPENLQKYTDDELLSWIASFVEVVGVVPTESEMDSAPGPDGQTIAKRFGTFTKAVKAAGYTPRGEKNE